MAREAAAAPGAVPSAPSGAGPGEPPLQVRPLKAQILLSMKRSFDLFAGDEASVDPPVYAPARDLAIASRIMSEYSGLACYVPRGADPSRPRRDPAISTSEAAKAAARVGDSIFARLRGDATAVTGSAEEVGGAHAGAGDGGVAMLTDGLGSESPDAGLERALAGGGATPGALAVLPGESVRSVGVDGSSGRSRFSSAASSAALQLALVSSARTDGSDLASASGSSALALSSATLAGQALRETGAVGGASRVRPAAGPKALTPAARAVMDALRTQEEADKDVALEAEAEERGSGQGAGFGKTVPGVAALPSSALALAGSAAPPSTAPPSSAQIARSAAARWPRPSWHAPWRAYRVISGHLGWVRSVAFEPGNEWFATGSGDRTIKVWDTASGRLKLTLTGHIEQVTGLAVSDRSPYLFSCGLDKMVKCWDLETNRVIRSYHGHLSGVRCLALHPELDILFTGGRDATCRVWDVRTRSPIHVLSGHDDAVATVAARATDPQVVTGSHDKTVRLWDLRTGKTLSVLTHHKKSVRALVTPKETKTLVSASADGIKKFLLPAGEYLHPFIQDQRAIINCLATNADGVLASGGDDGSLWFWDRHSGNAFQKTRSVAQPGSLEGEAAIMAASFDVTGTRLVTCEADKTIKMWKEDERATEETHPIEFVPPSTFRRY